MKLDLETKLGLTPATTLCVVPDCAPSFEASPLRQRAVLLARSRELHLRLKGLV